CSDRHQPPAACPCGRPIVLAALVLLRSAIATRQPTASGHAQRQPMRVILPVAAALLRVAFLRPLLLSSQTAWFLVAAPAQLPRPHPAGQFDPTAKTSQRLGESLALANLDPNTHCWCVLYG